MFQNVSHECQASFPIFVLQFWQHHTCIFHTVFLLVSPTLSWGLHLSLSSGIGRRKDTEHEDIQHPDLVAGISVI
jgi:hypothetical protein